MKKLLYIIILFSFLASIVLAATTDVSKTAKVGQQVTLTVTADGTTPFNYQWKKDGTAVAGATINPLVIVNSTTTNGGIYTVIVSNSAGSVVSNQAILTIMAPPVFTLQPINQSLVVGSAGTFSATATGNPAPTYQWYKNGVAISGATASSYSIAAIVQGDAGSYTCVATSTSEGVTSPTTSTTAILTVTVAPPVITGITIAIQ